MCVGTPITIAAGQADPLGIALSPTSVYWANHSDSSDPGGEIMRATPR